MSCTQRCLSCIPPRGFYSKRSVLSRTLLCYFARSDMKAFSSLLSFSTGGSSAQAKVSRILLQSYISLPMIPIVLACDQSRPRLLVTTKFNGLTVQLRNMEPSIPTQPSRGETVESAGASTSTPRPTRWFTCIKHGLAAEEGRITLVHGICRCSGLLVLTSAAPFSFRSR